MNLPPPAPISSPEYFMDAVMDVEVSSFPLPLPVHSSHTHQHVVSSSSPHSPLPFNAPATSPGTRIRCFIHDSPARGSTPLGLKDNVLVRTDRGAPGGGEEIRAYWIYRKLKKAIYGKVAAAYELRPYSGPQQQGVQEGAQCWELTGRYAAVKMLYWSQIHQNQGRFEEDPIKEVSCMQYLTSRPNSSNVLKHVAAWSDDRYLYSVMEYAESGELFDHVERMGKFTEPRARHWFRQILSGLATLQSAGICHRDLSLENLMVSQGRALVIDMGMCVRVPFLDGSGATTSVDAGRVRRLLQPGSRCGKPNYMSPEIVASTAPFDGYAIDVWAAGVILFIMLTGVPPFERASHGDARFRMGAVEGRLRQMLQSWGMMVSEDAADLMQRMLRANVEERLTLEQVRDHPWVQRVEVDEP